jgi:hypothetical protein
MDIRRRRRRRRPPPFIHVYTLFFRIEKNHLEIVFLVDYTSRDQIYHLSLRNTTVRTQTPLGVLHNLYIYTHTIWKYKGQITRASSSNHAKYRMPVVSFLWS